MHQNYHGYVMMVNAKNCTTYGDLCYAAMYVFIGVYVMMFVTLQYIIMEILQMFIVIYVFLYLNNGHHILETLTICMSHCYHLLYSL